MPWRALHDPDNPENNAAGNRSDWLKHTIWLSGLDALVRHAGLRALHSCHAGRGMYRIPVASERQANLQRLFADGGEPVLLQRAQRQVCAAMRVEPSDGAWYAGSALLCEWWRFQHGYPQCEHHLYEWHPDTRAVLSATLRQHHKVGHSPACVVVKDTHGAGRFDGETAVADSMAGWPAASALLLDPFGLWLHAKHAERRQRFTRIFHSIAARGEQAPATSLFFAWGGDGGSQRAAGALEPKGPHYRALRRLAGDSQLVLMEMHWRWDLHCSMWWLLPREHAETVAAAITGEVEALLGRFGGDPLWSYNLAP